MFGCKTIDATLREVCRLSAEIACIRGAVDELCKVNKEAVINKQVIDKFMDDLHYLVSISKGKSFVTEVPEEPVEDKPEELIKKKRGRRKRT